MSFSLDVDCPVLVGDKLLFEMKEFDYLGVLFTSEGRMEKETERQISTAS